MRALGPRASSPMVEVVDIDMKEASGQELGDTDTDYEVEVELRWSDLSVVEVPTDTEDDQH